jgi:hypothetical protein
MMEIHAMCRHGRINNKTQRDGANRRSSWHDLRSGDKLSETSLDIFCGPLVAEGENCDGIAMVAAFTIVVPMSELCWARIALGGFWNGYYVADLDSWSYFWVLF